MKKPFSLLLPALCLLLAVLGAHYARRQPVLFLPPDTPLDDPGRFIFLTESDRPAALVADLHQQSYGGRIALPAVAELSAVDRRSRHLLLSRGRSLYSRNLQNSAFRQTALPAPAKLLAAADGETLLVSADNDILRFHSETLQGQSRLRARGRPHSLHRAALKNLWLIVEDPPALHLLRNAADEHHPLPYRRSGQSALAPDNTHIAFAAEDDDGLHAVIYALEPLHEAYRVPLTEFPLRPLIDTRSAAAYFLSPDGEGLHISLREPLGSRRFRLSGDIRDIALAYMETRLIVRRENSISVYDSDTFALLHQEMHDRPLAPALFISADSKTAIYADAEQLHLLNILRQQRTSIPLPEKIRPRALFMGQGNTLCH